MMNPEIQEKWVNALESEEYSQTKGNLRTTSGYCCLGVLCDLYAKEKNVEWDYRYYDADKDEYDHIPESQVTHVIPEGDYYSFETEDEVIPLSVCEWAGLISCAPHIVCEHEPETSLIDMNDNGKSFKEIASLIRQYGVA